MGSTYNIVCDDCQQTLWIGQRGAGSTQPRIYTTEPHLQALNAFLIVHENHHLMFGFDDNFPHEPGMSRDEYRKFQMSDIPTRILVEWQLTDGEIAALRDTIEY